MWFPTFDKIHGLQKKYAESTNVQLTESKQKNIPWRCIYIHIADAFLLLLSSIQHHDWRDSEQHAGVHWFARHPSENNSGLSVVHTYIPLTSDST